ncbi:hypothetical protein ACTVZO_26100 [Streptomyces sp. IBSNAI002]|uniref:hypothetical protein n=1 Tax=Streptomyces sp. IBSNAI002 TaxID=3457500 RepID=UPI003FD1210E
MSARRPLLTALGATTLLAALWFVPSAGATAPGPGQGDSGVPVPAAANAARTATHPRPDHAPQGRQAPVALADTGSVDTTPYLLGGTLCLGVGAGFVAFSVRRSRTA